MKDCVFCNIIEGIIPSEKVYENDHVLAFLDVNPNNPGHTLVIPKKHHENIYTIPADEWGHVMEAVRLLSPKVKGAMAADGINIAMNNDRAAGQLVFHVHVHIIPRKESDGFQHWHGVPYEIGEIQEVGSRIRAMFRATK